MTKLEEKAEEHIKKHMLGCIKEQIEYFRFAKHSYIAGAKENGAVWHKQSDTDDIYDACNDWHLHCFVCKMKDGSYNIAFGNCEEDNHGMIETSIWFERKDSEYYADDIIAWCEIPIYLETDL